MDISEFRRLHVTNNYSRHPWEIARAQVLLQLLKKNIQLPKSSLIDVGSGDAYITNLLYGYQVAEKYFAIDNAYTPEIIEKLRINNLNAPVGYCISIEEFQRNNPDTNNSLYLCMDVLEHLKDEKEVLDLIVPASPASASGYYFVSVPAFETVFSNHDVLLGHYRRYTEKKLKTVLENKGLTVIDSGYFFFSLLVARWFEKKLLRKKDYSIDNWEGSVFKTRLITSVLKIDFRISYFLKKVGIKLPGLSCYCICHL